jgi:hypothetical protein
MTRPRWFAEGAGFVAQEPIHPRLHEAFLPTPDYRFALGGLPRDLGGTEAVRREQNDAGAQGILKGTRSLASIH